MPGMLRSLRAYLFHGRHGLQPISVPAPDAAIPPRRGIPDGSLDKLPRPDERPCEYYYSRDPLTHHFVQTPDPHTPGPSSGQQ